jgi:predicted permease
MSLWSRLKNLSRSGDIDRDIDDELQFHVEQRVRELVDDGMARDDAAALVARRFGNRLRLREESRDIKLLPWIDALARDVIFGLRRLRKDATGTTAAVVSLGLALGACVAAFSLVDALIFRPLPVAQPDRLIYLAFPTYTAERPESDTFNYPLFERLRDAARGRADLFAMSTQVMRPVIIDASAGRKELVRTQYVGGDAFGLLGVSATIGRLVTPADDLQPQSRPVAVLSHAFWMRRFAGDPTVLGRWVALEGKQLQIIGVAGARFTGVEPGRPTDVWLPNMMYDARAFGSREWNWFRIFGRLETNVPLEQAGSVLHAAFADFRRAQPVDPRRSPESIARYQATPLYVRSARNGPSPLRQEFERSLWILATTAALIFLIAGSNVTNLFLARTATREREMSLRVSIGAGRRRLVQQVLVESALLAIAACAVGFIVATAAAPTIVTLLASIDDPLSLDLGINWRVAAFAGALIVVATALFGLAPALHASRVAPMAVLRSAGERMASGRRKAMRPFVMAQIAFGMIVLFVGGLLMMSFVRLSRVSPGFASADVLLLSLDGSRKETVGPRRAAAFEAIDRLRGTPGVEAAGAAEFNILGQAWTHTFQPPGTQYGGIETNMKPVSDGFFEAMSIRAIDGRLFTRRDIVGDQSSNIVVSETFARLYFGAERAIGRRLEGRFGSGLGRTESEIVGIVADTKYDIRRPAVPTVYIPLRKGGESTLYVRAPGMHEGIAGRLRDIVQETSPLLRVSAMTPQSVLVEQTLLRERMLLLIAGFFACVGLVLVAVGVYGVLSFTVLERTREIGIRVALGARHPTIIRTMLADTGRAAILGLGVGTLGGVYLSRFVQALLFDVGPFDPWSLLLPALSLVVATALAAIIPAWRAARIDAAITLRHE